MTFDKVERAVDAIARGELVVVVDDEDRENEGDLTVAAEKVTPDIINFMARHGRGPNPSQAFTNPSRLMKTFFHETRPRRA